MSTAARTPLKALADGKENGTQSNIKTPQGSMRKPGEVNLQETNLKIAAENKALQDAKTDMEAKITEVLDEYDSLRKAYDALDESSRAMKVDMINMQEEAGEWKNSYDSLQAEGRELFQTYERKCTALKQATIQLEEAKKEASLRSVELTASTAEVAKLRESDKELKLKCAAHEEAASKHEQRYLSLKADHAQAVAKADALQKEVTALKSAGGPAPAGSAGGEDANADQMSQIASLEATVATLTAALASRPEASESSPAPAGGAAFATPRRSVYAPNTPKLEAKTPGGVMRDLEGFSPDGMRSHAESLVISNDLLRQELAALKEQFSERAEREGAAEGEKAKMAAALDETKAKLAAAEERRVEAVAMMEDAKRGEEEALEALDQERSKETNATSELEAQLAEARSLLDDMEAKVIAADAEKSNMAKKLATQTEATKNAEKDMRMMYKRHKKEMSELSEKFKEGQYEDRYLKAVGKAARLQTILDGWVSYAQELSQVRQLQVEHDSTASSVEEGLGQLMSEFERARGEAAAKVGKWCRQTHRMEAEMTQLVRIKTKALEDRKALQEKLSEMTGELEAQGEYTQNLEEDLTSRIEASQAESEAAQAKLVVESLANATVITGLNDAVARLESEAGVSDKMFADATAMLQDKEEEAVALRKQLGDVTKELEGVRKEVEENEAFREAEDTAAQEALDELTRNLQGANEQLANAQDAADKAEVEESNCKLAAACAITRLTQVVLAFAPALDEDVVDMVDSELKNNIGDEEYESKMAESKKSHELRALLVGLASAAEHLLSSAQQKGADLQTKLSSGDDKVASLEEQVVRLRGDRDALMKESAIASEVSQQLAEASQREELLHKDVAMLRSTIDEAKRDAENKGAALTQLREEKAEMEGILEETTRENVDMSNYKLEAEALRDAVIDLQGQLEEAKETRAELEKVASEAKNDVELLSARGDKKLNALRQNLLRSEGECQQLDALMAHVRAVIHMFLDSSGSDLTMLKRLHQRLNPDDQEDEA